MIIKKIIRFFKPSSGWLFTAIILSGIFTGIGAYSFYISRAYSYLSDKPETCVNCHIMAPQYATWDHSSHKAVTNCNDCHVPHNNVLNKYYFKAKDGIRHATMYTMRAEPQVIFIKEAGQQVVQNNCIRCHEGIFDRMLAYNNHPQQGDYIKNKYCWECHRETPHGRINSLSAVPNARVPLPESPVPSWMSNLLSDNSKGENKN